MARMDRNTCMAVVPALLLAFLLIGPSAAAQKATYVSLRPDSEPYCFSINFGEKGSGEYSLYVKDPGYPGSPWASIHAARFAASSSNIVIVPICISAEGKRLGDETMLELTVEAPPAKNTTYKYGVCVRRNEDIDVAETGSNPCDATVAYTDIFSAGLLESDIEAKAGEKVWYTLAIASDFMLSLALDKISGPEMMINETRAYTPGQKTIGIEITAPQEAGEYPFSIKVSVDGCDDASCRKTVEGTLTVTAADAPVTDGFRVQLSPETSDVHGANPAVYYLTVRNLQAQQTFKTSVTTDDGLSSDFAQASDIIGKNSVRTYTITVLPKSGEAALHTIKAVVEGGDGVKKAVSASLSVHEVISDIEDNPSSGGVTDEYANDYSNDADLKEWQSQKDKSGGETGDFYEPGTTAGADTMPIFIIVAIAIAVIAVASFFIYKKTRVVRDEGSAYFEPADGS